jgi:hypothetical protein
MDRPIVFEKEFHDEVLEMDNADGRFSVAGYAAGGGHGGKSG